MKQQTINSEATVSGIGLHTGEKVTMTFKPAPANNGYKFIRTDLETHPEILAEIVNVVRTNRGTTIRKGSVEVNT
ncbi:MAG: UDP-3-O-acyl-N-acetylglucosamine deacetylase, partial [Bacteroidia bacterium]|nr:UDP-3-O-acyl-N-acetylglucosamine deacetylase [Bacteroidia bacterium]